MTPDVVAPVGFSLVSEWKGRAREHRWKHVCGGVFSAPIQDLERATSPRTGCKFCDVEGQPGRWMEFLRRLDERGLSLNSADRMAVLQEADDVPLRCQAHPQASVALWSRKKLVIWMAPNENGKARKLLSPCPDCNASQALHEQASPAAQQKSQDQLAALADRLKPFGHSVRDWKGSSVRGADGKVRTVKNTLVCDHCQTGREAFVLQDLAKAEKRGSMTCPGCSHTTHRFPV